MVTAILLLLVITLAIWTFTNIVAINKMIVGGLATQD
jgi:hypothetical protein